MEEQFNEMLERIKHIEDMLDDRYRFKEDEKSIENYLNDIDVDNIINTNCNMIYEAYKLTTEKPASIRKLNARIKEKFGLKTKHTYKNKTNIYYWTR